jgi:hypothetical protein
MSPSSPLRTVAPTETALVDTVRRLIECESPSADDEAVSRSADVVEEVGTALLGVAPERIVVDGCTHLRWRFGAVTRVLLLAHHDTVWPIGTLTRLPFSVQDGVMRGPGSFDMKTGLAMMLHAIAALDDREGEFVLGREHVVADRRLRPVHRGGDPRERGPRVAVARELRRRSLDDLLAGPGLRLLPLVHRTPRSGLGSSYERLTARGEHAVRTVCL